MAVPARDRKAGDPRLAIQAVGGEPCQRLGVAGGAVVGFDPDKIVVDDLDGLFARWPEQRIVVPDMGQQPLTLRRQAKTRLRCPAFGGCGAVQDAHIIQAHRIGGFRLHPRHGLQQPVQPAVAQAHGVHISAGPRFQHILAVEMAALVAVWGGYGGRKGQLARPPQGHQRGQRRVQGEKPVQVMRAPFRPRRQGLAQGSQAGIAIRLEHVQSVHRATQDDDDQAVVARHGGKGDGGQQRMGCGRTADQGRGFQEQAAGQHRVISG